MQATPIKLSKSHTKERLSKCPSALWCDIVKEQKNETKRIRENWQRVAEGQRLRLILTFVPPPPKCRDFSLFLAYSGCDINVFALPNPPPIWGEELASPKLLQTSERRPKQENLDQGNAMLGKNITDSGPTSLRQVCLLYQPGLCSGTETIDWMDILYIHVIYHINLH